MEKSPQEIPSLAQAKFHSLRHTFSTRLRVVVEEDHNFLMGHKTGKMSELSRLLEAANRIVMPAKLTLIRCGTERMAVD